LKSPRPEILQKQKLGKVVKITFVGNREHGAKPLPIDVIGADLMMTRQAQVAHGALRRLGILTSDIEQLGLRRPGLSIHEVQNHALILANNSGVRFGDKVSH